VLLVLYRVNNETFVTVYVLQITNLLLLKTLSSSLVKVK